MQFASTRHADESVDFPTALHRGLAPDGGLYHPTTDPNLKTLIRGFNRDTSFVEMCGSLTAALFPETYTREQAYRIAERAFPFSPAVSHLTDSLYFLELFHGPSCAFKDFGASFLATVMEDYLASTGERATILTATSGDTGSAVAHAFHNKQNIEVVILYPSGRVSPLQEKQLTTLTGNITAVEVQGSFDDCQRMVKEAFLDPELKERYQLTSANSINIGRLIPQSFYYIYAFSQLRERLHDEFLFCVPSGNFGNLTAGVLAWRWGMPANRFLAATNANDEVPKYLESGLYRPRPSIQTIANAMDVGDPSNFERLMQIFGNEHMAVTSMILGHSSSDDEIRDTMREYWTHHQVLLCPHTSAGVRAVDQARTNLSDGAAVVLATAHAGKFSEVVKDATGQDPEIPERLAKLLDLPKQAVLAENTLEALRNVLVDRFG